MFHSIFDDFKNMKGQMAFEYVDAETGDILDILDRVTAGPSKITSLPTIVEVI